MAIEDLRPVWDAWIREDFKDMSTNEMELLLLYLRRKTDLVKDCFERKLFLECREQFIQLKERQYAEQDAMEKSV